MPNSSPPLNHSTKNNLFNDQLEYANRENDLRRLIRLGTKFESYIAIFLSQNKRRN